MRPHQLQTVVDELNPAVIGLQETKVTDEQFPHEIAQALGYTAFVHGQKTHYGVAMLVRQDLITDPSAMAAQVIRGFAGEASDHQRRFIGLKFGDITIYNGYFPQGESRDHPIKFPAKQAFYERLLALLTQHDPSEQVIVMGDLNVAPTDLDVGLTITNARRWLQTGKCSFLPEERAWLENVYDWGLTDTFRHIYPDSDALSWFDYRSRGFEQEPRRGLRIDHILATKSLLARCAGVGILHGVRGQAKPSDHCPVWAEFTTTG